MPTSVGRRTNRLAPTSRVDRRTVVRLGIVAAVSYAAWLAIGAFGRPYNFFDMKIYHGAVVWWASGNELYDFVAPSTTLGFTYPPFAGVVMLPMSWLPVDGAGFVNALASIAALAVVLAALLRPIVDRLGWPLWFTVGIATPLAVAIEPSRETLGYGQVNLLLFALSWPTWWACAGAPSGAPTTRPPTRRWPASSTAARGRASASGSPPPSSSPRRCSSRT